MAQEFPQPLEDEAQVVADGAHDGVDLVAEAAFQEVAAEMAVHLAMSDDGFDGGSSPQFASDLPVDGALLTGFEDPPRIGRVVAPVALVHISPLDLAAGQRLGFLDRLLQGVTAIGTSQGRIARSRFTDGTEKTVSLVRHRPGAEKKFVPRFLNSCHKLATNRNRPIQTSQDLYGLQRTGSLWQKRPRRANFFPDICCKLLILLWRARRDSNP